METNRAFVAAASHLRYETIVTAAYILQRAHANARGACSTRLEIKIAIRGAAVVEKCCSRVNAAGISCDDSCWCGGRFMWRVVRVAGGRVLVMLLAAAWWKFAAGDEPIPS